MSFAYASSMNMTMNMYKNENNTALTATTQNANTTTTTTVRRPLFSSFSTKALDIDSEDLLHPALYPVPAISRLSRDRTRASTLSFQDMSKPTPSLALASAIARKHPVIPSSLTFAQRVSEDTQDVEDANELFALIASTKETLMLAPTPVAAAFPKTNFNSFRVPDFSFNNTWTLSPVDNASPSSSYDSEDEGEDYFDFDFQFDDDEYLLDEDDAHSVSSASSVDSCFDFLASTKPQSLFKTSFQRPASPPIPATVFVPPQVRSNMNMTTRSPFSFSNLPRVQVNTNTRARAESIVSTSSLSSESTASSAGSWRSSFSSSHSSSSSRASISSASSVSSYSASSSPIQKAKPIPSAFSFPSPASAPKTITAPISKPAAALATTAPAAATKTKYLYQGGVSTVLGGGVMLGGGSRSNSSTSAQAQSQTQRQRSTYTNNAANANSSSWRRRY